MACGWAAAAGLQMMSSKNAGFLLRLPVLLCKVGSGLLLLADLNIHQYVAMESVGDRLA